MTSLSFSADTRPQVTATELDQWGTAPPQNPDTSFAWALSGTTELRFQQGGGQTASGQTVTLVANRSGVSGTLTVTGSPSNLSASIPVSATGGAIAGVRIDAV